MLSLFQSLLLKLDPETSHNLALGSMAKLQRSPLAFMFKQKIADKPTTVMGIEFKNPVGLAAGLDKNGECIDAFAAMGFGFVEIGTVTPKPQPGNEKPRIFRLPSEQAIINRMGFNNHGVDYLVEQVKKSQYQGVLGINIGKNKATPEDQALQDYLICLDKVYPHADYVTVNISSPNTPGLRNLQYGDALDQLLNGLKLRQKELADKYHKYVPIAVKIAPDLSADEVSQIAESFNKAAIDGVIATNTTLDRSKVEGLPHADEAGGLSGEVLTEKSNWVVRELRKILDKEIPIIGVGGIHDAETAKQRLAAGADLIQVYSAFIYQGPKLVKQIVDSIEERVV